MSTSNECFKGLKKQTIHMRIQQCVNFHLIDLISNTFANNSIREYSDLDLKYNAFVIYDKKIS